MRLVEENELIDNNARMLKAAEKIFAVFSRHSNPDIRLERIAQRWHRLKEQLKNAMDESYWLGGDDRARIKAYRTICKDMPEYEKKKWRHDAVEKREFETDLFDRNWGKKNFFESPWYKFHEAVKEHRESALKRLKPLYKKARLKPYGLEAEPEAGLKSGQINQE